MSHRWAALVLVLALCAFMPKNAAGQVPKTAPRAQAKGKLGQNYPNPLNPETRIPFSVECGTGGEAQLHSVSLVILNALAQQIAIPVFEGVAPGSIGSAPSAAGGMPIRNLPLPCGAYIAYWDGNYQGTKKEVASGIVIARLVIDGGQPIDRKMFVRK